MYKPCPYYGKRLCQLCSGQLTISRVCTNLAPRPMTVVIGLGMRLCVHLRTKLENGILGNGQQSGSAVNSFIHQGELEAMKTLSGPRALRCDKYQFRDNMTVST